MPGMALFLVDHLMGRQGPFLVEGAVQMHAPHGGAHQMCAKKQVLVSDLAAPGH